VRAAAFALCAACLGACAEGAPLRGEPVAGLVPTLRAERSSYRTMERVVFDFEITNASGQPADLPPLRCWDRRYSWHASAFKESEGELVVRDVSRPRPATASRASG